VNCTRNLPVLPATSRPSRSFTCSRSLLRSGHPLSYEKATSLQLNHGELSVSATPALSESVEKRFCGREIGRIEPLGEPVIDRLKQCLRVSRTPLIVQQPRKAPRGA
jgi:hypothetical protein